MQPNYFIFYICACLKHKEVFHFAVTSVDFIANCKIVSYQTDDAASCGFPVMIPNMYFETLMARKEKHYNSAECDPCKPFLEC